MKKYILIIIFFASTIVFAQAPDKMSYQAVVRDASDVLITNTTVGMQISILEGSPTGTEVYVETHTPTTNDNGLVSLEIGDGTVVLGDFSSIIWGTGSYYLKTETDPTGGTSYSIEGTSQLLSVPYAFYSNSTTPIDGNTLDEAYDQEGSGSPSTRTIIVDDGIIELEAAGYVALSVISDTALPGMVIDGFGGGALTLNVEAGGDALDIDVAATGDKGITIAHMGTGHGLEIVSTNAANASNALEVFYNGTSNAVSVTSGGGADGIDVTYSGTAEAIHSVVTAGNPGNGLKILNMGTGDGAYIDNSTGTGDDGLQIDQFALGEAVEINIGGAGATGNGIIVNNDGAASKSLEVNNTNPAGTSSAVKIDNAGIAKALEIFNGNPGNPSEALKVTQAGLATALFVDNGGLGKGLHVFNGVPGNGDVALLANSMGLGSVAMLNTDDNNINISSTLVSNNMGAGTVAEFITTDEPFGKVNSMPTVNVVSNGKGVGVNIDILNDLVGSDINAEPALYVHHRGYGAAAYFSTAPSDASADSVEIINGGAGAGLHIDCIGSTTDFIDNALHVEQSNISAFPSLGYAALFELKSPTTAADSAVKISSVATSAGSSALRVIPADPTKLAAVFEGKVEVASDILIGGTMTAAAKAFKIDHPLDPTNKFLVHNSIESNERINIYSGNITTNSDGFATIMLPDYMCALNTDFKYQLTIVDKSFAQAIIWEPMNTDTNSFVIKTNTPEIKVSWQITGTRQDTWAKENPMKVEVEKPKDF
ncbi:hypothetical protein KXJ69_00535 [Aureisphaera sp. CAU 1614]|uniref:Uncharacterized protein n=1 Tax=Halomarinibacterium sedimenti TaxID=2857106 RepID=A0A9X1FME3_9FLAO|nr:hypothetical protein [Halomarinibacterium sedimenti]MBW2936569.1 hypothetical protein [Halomarinibacterium sedimenti]